MRGQWVVKSRESFKLEEASDKLSFCWGGEYRKGTLAFGFNLVNAGSGFGVRRRLKVQVWARAVKEAGFSPCPGLVIPDGKAAGNGQVS